MLSVLSSSAVHLSEELRSWLAFRAQSGNEGRESRRERQTLILVTVVWQMSEQQDSTKRPTTCARRTEAERRGNLDPSNRGFAGLADDFLPFLALPTTSCNCLLSSLSRVLRELFCNGRARSSMPAGSKPMEIHDDVLKRGSRAKQGCSTLKTGPSMEAEVMMEGLPCCVVSRNSYTFRFGQ